MPSTFRFTRWDGVVTTLFVCAALVLVSPWRIVPHDLFLRGAYVLLLHALCAGASIHALVRSWKARANWPWRTLFVIGSVAGILSLVPRVVFFGLPIRFVSGTPYISAEDADHKVLWIHNHGYLHNWNTFVRVIEFQGMPFCLETDFEEADLHGVWRKYSLDSKPLYEGTARYVKGEVVEVITEAQ